MIKNRVAYTIWLSATAVLYIFGNDAGTRVIFYASLIIPFIFICIAGILARYVKITLHAPEKRTCGEAVRVYIATSRTLGLLGHIQYHVLCENIFTGERWENINEFTPAHCGIHVFTLPQPKMTDIFCLSAWKMPPPVSKRTLILPKRHPVSIEMDANKDPGEAFAIREYMAGDPLKSIHWKLSSKTNTLLVREADMPELQNVLVLVEATSPQGQTLPNPNEVHNMAEKAYSIAHALLMEGIPQTLGRLNATTYESHEICDTEGLDTAFTQLLSNTIEPTYAAPAYEEICAQYAHVIHITAVPR
ncbi:MAG: DUF58 domain-containing protein [Defluviitaleaceae bacterium]|nr:DUF58 domain-containing protein [Defluviitaleaceae bacterium]MCL2276182.1 DUF58 domain-containing protein [Defluviitaleaceae bacterium]